MKVHVGVCLRGLRRIRHVCYLQPTHSLIERDLLIEEHLLRRVTAASKSRVCEEGGEVCVCVCLERLDELKLTGSGEFSKPERQHLRSPPTLWRRKVEKMRGNIQISVKHEGGGDSWAVFEKAFND